LNTATQPVEVAYARIGRKREVPVETGDPEPAEKKKALVQQLSICIWQLQ
jgi:hypothetical protein